MQSSFTTWPVSSQLENTTPPIAGPSNHRQYFLQHLPPCHSAPLETAQYQTMAGTAVIQPMAPNPWHAQWPGENRAGMAAPIGPAAQPSNRFDQLLRAKLAAEQRSGSSNPAPTSAAPAGLDVAMSKLQNTDTVFNRSFVSQYYVNHAETKPAPVSPGPQHAGPSNQPQPSFDTGASQSGQSLPLAQPQRSPQPIQPSPARLAPPPAFDAGTDQLGSQQLTANFRSMVAQRINTMYASAQAQTGMPEPAQPQLRLEIPTQPHPVFHVTPTSPVASPSYQQAPSPYALAPSPTIPQGPSTPVYKYTAPYSDTRSQPDQVKREPEWSSGYQQPPPFMWNVTPPQHGVNPMLSSSVPSLHSTSDSLDSRLDRSPLTPQHVAYHQVPSPIDVKPIISPALSTVTLPCEEGAPYSQYGPGLFAGVNGQARYTSASGEGHTNGGSMGNGMYDTGAGDGYVNVVGDGSNGLEGLGFGSNGDGGGGGDDHDQNGNGGDDQGPPDLIVPTPRQKKLPLACHFCRRRKLKCDGIKPVCDNCNKRGIECTYDDHVRRRGPGKRTKEMRDRAAREAAEAGLISNVNPSVIGVGQAAQIVAQHIPQAPDSQGSPSHLEVDHSDLMLDPALADETGVPRHDDVMEAMGALKQAGIELGLHQDDVDDLGEPSTLAQLSELGGHDHQHLEHVHVHEDDQHGHEHAHDLDDEETRKRKAEYDIEEESKRIRLSLTQDGDVDGLDLLHHVDVSAHDLQ